MYFQRKFGNKYHNLTYGFSLQPVPCLQFHWNRKYFSSVILGLGGRLFMAPCYGFHLFDRERKYEWLVHKEFLLDWSIFLLYLLQSACCSKYTAKSTSFSLSNLFLHFLHQLALKYLRIFVTVMRSNSTVF